MLIGGGRTGRGHRFLGFSVRSASRSEQLLDSADRIAVLVEQPVDPVGERDVGGTVITAIAGALKRPQLWEASLPVAQYMLRDTEVAGELADGSESLVAFAGRLDGQLSCRWRYARA